MELFKAGDFTAPAPAVSLLQVLEQLFPGSEREPALLEVVLGAHGQGLEVDALLGEVLSELSDVELSKNL